MKPTLCLLVAGLMVVYQTAAQHSQGTNEQTDSKTKTLTWCVPTVVVLLVFLIITALIVYTVYRQKKYGAFCCFMPKMRYHVGASEEEERERFDRQDYPSPPPSYDMSHRHIIAPPEYQDALQDVLLDSANSSPSGPTAPADSRFTAWTNIEVYPSVLPDYASATATTAVLTSESDGEEQPPPNSITTSSSSSSLCYTTTVAAVPTSSLVASSEEITGAHSLAHSQPTSDRVTELEKQSRQNGQNQ